MDSLQHDDAKHGFVSHDNIVILVLEITNRGLGSTQCSTFLSVHSNHFGCVTVVFDNISFKSPFPANTQLPFLSKEFAFPPC